MIEVVFFHIGKSGLGGGEKMLFRLLESLDRDTFGITLLSTAEDKLCEKARPIGIDVQIVPFRGALDTYNRRLLSDKVLIPPAIFRMIQFNWRVSTLLRQADVIWCQNLRAVLTLLPYLSISRTPSIWNVGLGMNDDGPVRYLQWFALQTADYVFIESEEQASRVFTENQYKHNKEKFTIFNKGIDTSEFNPARFDDSKTPDSFIIGTAASLTPRKGIEHLIDAIPKILSDYDAVTFLIAGEPPDGDEEYERELHTLVNQYGIEDYISFLGWIDDMPGFLNTLDVFVLPSLNEGIPGAVREALAMEVPVVATDVGGTSEAVIQGKTGFLVESEDPEQIAEKILKLLSDQSMRKEFGERGRNHMIEKFSMESYVRDYENFIQEIAGDD